MIDFQILQNGAFPPTSAQNKVFLAPDKWNDYSFVTMFSVYAFDFQGKKHSLGNVKIGFSGQTTEVSTRSTLETNFKTLPEEYFSLGMDVEYYQTLKNNFSEEFTYQYLGALKDIVANPSSLERASGEEVFKTSLLRDVSISLIDGQFKHVIAGSAPLTDFNFEFKSPRSDHYSGVEMAFSVEANSYPSTNIHAIIGRNGVGKTTILNDMINSVVRKEKTTGRFYSSDLFEQTEIGPNFFSGIVSVSFSVFDPFPPPPEQTDPELGPRYHYVGLKDCEDESGTRLREMTDLREEFSSAIASCARNSGKKKRWLQAIATLESDENFSAMRLSELIELPKEALKQKARDLLTRMSSGHEIVLTTVTRLVETVEEKTLVLLDEPESHLHPPLLSALTRALSELLYTRNGVAIIATHSPVVLQEIPKSCVWKVTRSRLSVSLERPKLETFGENVGILTREIFGLEVVSSGYHTVLEEATKSGGSYEEIIASFRGALGQEAKAVLRALIASRDSRGAKQ